MLTASLISGAKRFAALISPTDLAMAILRAIATSSRPAISAPVACEYAMMPTRMVPLLKTSALNFSRCPAISSIWPWHCITILAAVYVPCILDTTRWYRCAEPQGSKEGTRRFGGHSRPVHVFDRVPPDKAIPLGLHVLRQPLAGAVTTHDTRAEASHKLLVDGRLDAFPGRTEGEDGAGIQGS